MKYIEKHETEQKVVAYEEQLREVQLDGKSLKDPSVHPSSDGKAIYDMVKSMPTFAGLKDQLFEDQGGICCYCGQQLVCEGHPFHTPFIVEHVYPKGLDRTQAGEYNNLLLSCCPSQKEEDARNKAPKKEKASFFHCDKSKGETPIIYTPLQGDIDAHFSYDEFGNVIPNDETAQADCDTLNLNCDWLIKRRCAAIEGQIYDETNELLSDEELESIADVVMARNDNNQHQEFCFAIKAAIQRLLDK